MTQQYPSRAAAPTATYRLQLQPEFPFDAARAAVPYLASLGVSHLHLSPVLEAVPGSAHGYDVVDHTRVREELGGEAGLRALSDAARRHGMGLVLDIVPNHMAVPAPARLNRPLWEVLREGQESPYARWFDIDWEAGGGRLLLPVLGDDLGRDALEVSDGVLRYGPHAFPLRAGTAGLPLPELLAAQWYRLGWWRLARTDLNYRRFFTISELIGVRVEDPVVFRATHDKVLELVRDGVAQGLRIDHPDGLADPEAYLRRLAAETGDRAWTVVEKILTRTERLPARWPVAGTTGYDTLYRLDGLLTDPAGAAELAHLYAEFTGLAGAEGGTWQATARQAVRELLRHDLVAEVETLVRMAVRGGGVDAGAVGGRAGDAGGVPGRGVDAGAVREAVREMLAAVPVYRPYPRDGGAAVVPEPGALRGDPGALALVRELALGGDPAFEARFAQTSAALRAKSLEDRAFYRYAPLLSATEVGGDPERPAVPVEEFHAYAAGLARDWPDTGTVLSTHDTKRSGDVRARIAVLSQCPERWREVLGLLPAGPDEQVAWVAAQTVFGLGGREPERVARALGKAVKEAALRTSWTDPDPEYEAAVEEWAAGADLSPVLDLAAELAPHARANVLSATLLHLTMPGVPEVYQGCETDYRALVDPDNRAAFAPPGGRPGREADLPGRDAGAPGRDAGAPTPPAAHGDRPAAGAAGDESPALAGPAPTPYAARGDRTRTGPTGDGSPAVAGNGDRTSAGPTGDGSPTPAGPKAGAPTTPAARGDWPSARPTGDASPAPAGNEDQTPSGPTEDGSPAPAEHGDQTPAGLAGDRAGAPAPPAGDGSPEPAPPGGDEKLALTRAALLLRRARPAAFGAEGGYEPLAVRGPAAEHCVAFCRGGEAVTVATRLSLRLAAAGGWRDTEVRLPPGRWAPVFPSPGNPVSGGGWLPVAALLTGSPSTLLAREV